MALRSCPIPHRSHWFLVASLVLVVTIRVVQAKDLYNILGVEKNASQRDIQKAFHRMSLKHHPDKSKEKDAHAKFAEINNAYDILSDEEKRKNYDMYGDEQGRGMGPEPRGPSSGHTDSQGWSHFSFNQNDNGEHSFHKHSQGFGSDGGFSFPFGGGFGGHERSFSFDFGGDSSFMGNIFENLFGSRNSKDEGNHFFSGSKGNQWGGSRSQGGKSDQYNVSAKQLNSRDFKTKVLDQAYTWAILFYTLPSPEVHEMVTFLEKIASNLHGSVKVGLVDCQVQQSLCREQKVWPLKSMKLYLFSLRKNGKVGSVEYTGDYWMLKNVKDFFVEALPEFSVRPNDIYKALSFGRNNPQALLFTKKKSTPAIWRALSGLFYKRVLFYDVQVDDVTDPTVKRFGVGALPAIVGIFANGESSVLTSGNSLEQANLSLEKLKKLIEDFEKNSALAGPGKATAQSETDLPLLSKKNADKVCGINTPVCFIAAFKSKSGKQKAEQIMKTVSQKTFVRRGQGLNSVKDPISFSLLDAIEQSSFLRAFEKSRSSNKDIILIAYKPRKSKYAFHDGPFNSEHVESFIAGILSGDVQPEKVYKGPMLV